MHKLTVARIKKGYSIASLAKHAGVSPAVIARIEAREDLANLKGFRTNEHVAELIAIALFCKKEDLFSQKELSHLGRPPQTGRPLTPTVHSFEKQCKCGIIQPQPTECIYC